MPHVVSTLATATTYTDYEINPEGGPHVLKGAVTIRGGHGVANGKNAEIGIFTPNGVATSITDEQAEFLEKNKHFQEHARRGFVQMVKQNSAPKTAKITTGMAKTDGSRPLVAEDFNEGGRAAMPKLPMGDTWDVKVGGPTA